MLITTLTACSPGSPIKEPLTLIVNVTLPADTTVPSLDLLSLDSRSGHLYVPHGSLNALDIVDARTAKLLGSVSGLKGVKGIAVTPDPVVVFTSNSMDGSVSIVDTAAKRILSTIKVGGSPDAIVYDSKLDLVLVSLGSRKTVAFIDPQAKKLLGEMPIPGKPELIAVDESSGSFYLAINDKDEVVEIDPVARSITKTYKGCDIKSPTGVILDPDSGRLFVVNSVPHSANVVSVIDVVIDRCLGSIDIDHGPDQAAFNSHLHHMYVANAGSNNMSIIDTVSLKPLGVFGTGRQALTIAADPGSDRVCVAIGHADAVAIYHDP